MQCMEYLYLVVLLNQKYEQEGGCVNRMPS